MKAKCMCRGEVKKESPWTFQHMLRSRGFADGKEDICQQFEFADMQKEEQWDLTNLVHFQVNLSFQLEGRKGCS